MSMHASICVAAILAALMLQGCRVPDVVVQECKDQITHVLANLAINASDKLIDACKAQHVNAGQQTACIGAGTDLQQKAAAATTQPVVDACTNYAAEVVCKSKSEAECKDDLSKMPLDQGLTAVQDFVAQKMKTLNTTLVPAYDEALKAAVSMRYEVLFNARVVPAVVTSQCNDKFRAKSLSDALLVIMKKCANHTNEVKCLEAHEDLKKEQEDNFVKDCAKAALKKACPKGSNCAISTEDADLGKTSLAAWVYVNDHFDTWKHYLVANLQTYTIFYSLNFKDVDKSTSTSQTVSRMATFGFALVLIGAVIFFVARRASAARSTTSSQPENVGLVDTEPDPESSPESNAEE